MKKKEKNISFFFDNGQKILCYLHSNRLFFF